MPGTGAGFHASINSSSSNMTPIYVWVSLWCREQDRDSGRSGDLPKATELEVKETGFEPGSYWLYSLWHWMRTINIYDLGVTYGNLHLESLLHPTFSYSPVRSRLRCHLSGKISFYPPSLLRCSSNTLYLPHKKAYSLYHCVCMDLISMDAPWEEGLL